MKGWLKDRRLCICILLAVLIIYHLYFLWLSSVKMELSELLYADFMLFVVIGVCTVSDWYRWLKKTEGWQNAMQTASYVLSEERMIPENCKRCLHIMSRNTSGNKRSIICSSRSCRTTYPAGRMK